MRVSCLPTRYDEKLVLRISDNRNVARLSHLGLTREVQGQLEELIQRPDGLFLVTGPIGSGKTTTLYSLLSRLNTAEKNIVAIESLCEYRLPGVTQVQLNKKAGQTLEETLRAVLYEHAEVILAEPVDRELFTAAEAGCLVFSSLSADDASSALMGLSRFDVEPARIAENVIGVLAQRLVRKVCPNCKETYEADAAELRWSGFKLEDPTQKVQLARDKGCELCRHTGYKGRIGLYELLRMNTELAGLVTQQAAYARLLDAARGNGMHLLREDALLKILEGVTTPEEMQRIGLTQDFRT